MQAPRWLVPTAAGVAAAGAAVVLVSVAAAALLALVVAPVAWSWASAGGTFHPRMFTSFASAAFAAVFVAYLPTLVLAGVAADATAYTLVTALREHTGATAGVAALVCAAPALALGALGLWAVTTLLALQAIIGSSSYGHRLPGDPGNRIYLTLAATALVATVLGVAAWGLAVVLRPVLGARWFQRSP